MSKGEYLIVPKGTKFTGAGKLGLNLYDFYLGTGLQFHDHSILGNDKPV